MPDLDDFYSTDGEILDDDGYPTDDVLALIPRWTDTPRQLIEQVLDPIFATYGIVSVGLRERLVTGPNRAAEREARYEVRLVTGGWSGCESAVSALREGLLWLLWWESSHRGGVYAFEIPEDKMDQPMPAWSPPGADVEPRSRVEGDDPESHVCDTGYFDRTICPEPCGSMHSYCTTCESRQDRCAWDTAGPNSQESNDEQ